jgi:hypothetical protein
MENKYYLKSIKLTLNKENGIYFYECKYSNGYDKKFILMPFVNELKINTEIV